MWKLSSRQQSQRVHRYNNLPENLKTTAAQDIVQAVLDALDARAQQAAEKEREKEINDLLGDLDEYGI